MNPHYRIQSKIHLTVLTIFILSILTTACSVFQQTDQASDEPIFEETVENYPQAEVVIQVKLPTAVVEGEKVILEIVDDVTGVYFNPSQYEMVQQDKENYFIRLPFTIGEKIKYRFMRRGSQQYYEQNSQNEEIRYRVLYVNGPLLIQDLVAGWTDQPYVGPVGRIRGQLLDKSNNEPLPNMIVYAGGMQTISASDGSFILEGIPIWIQNVVVSSLDGSYGTFQQGALIAEEATTPIFIGLQKRSVVDVEFEVKTPDGFETDLPLKLATNLYSLGYPETDLPAGSNMVSSMLPVFTKTSSNTYSLNLSLPVGTDLRYKFTFGDGFWNSELSESGNFVVRELVVSPNQTAIRKQIQALTFPTSSEVVFNITTPVTTPVDETISLQLNPFGWMQPLEMVKTGEKTWSYTLYSPTHLLGNIEYRFCRNEQCEIAPSDPVQNGFFASSNSVQVFSINIENWQNMASTNTVTNVDTFGNNVQARTDFITGFELASDLPITWKTSIDQGLTSTNMMGANWTILSPTWSISTTNPPLLEPIPGTDLLWPDLQLLATKVTSSGLQPVLFPQLSNSKTELALFWSEAKKDAGWWQTLFDRYHRFILQNADLANIVGAGGIIIGDPAMRPAMSDGKLSDGKTSSPPQNADEQWSQLITDIRARYNGPVIGVVSIPDQNSVLPAWLDDVDAIYVLFSPSLADSTTLTVTNIESAFGVALDSLVQPLYVKYNKPVIIGINYPSMVSSTNGCTAVNDSCERFELSEIANGTIDLDLQARIYNAAIVTSACRSWITGFISRGYDPTVVVKDQSSSVYGKTSADVIWFWYHFILNKSY